VFARAPVPGQCKTRLSAALGAERACALYCAFLEDVCARAGSVAARRLLAVAGDPAHPELARVAGAYGLERMAQPEGDLGRRMARLLEAELGRGPALVIGSDAPTLPRAYLVEAFARLDERDVVVGPSTDGGYWGIGLRRAAPSLFVDMPWSTARVLPETLRRTDGARTALLPLHYDVDEPEDLALLRAELGLFPEAAPTTARALAALDLL
jgi:rSAM/selenodomain-associated transferase 1